MRVCFGFRLRGCRWCGRFESMAATVAEALAVTDELALPLRAVGDLAAAAGVSREEVVVITQCASLGELLLVSFGLFEYFSPEICLNTESIYSD